MLNYKKSNGGTTVNIKFQSLKLENFKSHQDLEVKFGDLTKITGDNAKGKSSLLEAITFLFYGVDALGSKLDPTPITYAADQTLVQALLKVDEKDLLLGKVLKKGKVSYYINEVPKKATEFNELLTQLFDKDLFLSLLNPNYFFTMKMENQRSTLLRYVSAPANKEVLKQLPDVQAEKLGTLLKKHNLSDIEKMHRENKTSLEKKHIAAQSRTKTLKGQLDQNVPSAAVDSLRVELTQLIKQRDEIEQITDKAGSVNGRINVLNHSIRSLTIERDQMKDDFQTLKNEPIKDTCRTCKQPLQEEAVQAVEADKENRMETFKVRYQQVVDKRKELESELQSLEYIDVSEQLDKARSLQEQISPIERELDKHKQYERLSKQLEEAQKDEKEILDSLNDSIFVIDTVKAFKAKEAQIQAEKVQALFSTLSIRLFNELKTTGELKPTFEIEMDGKPYNKLSLSEGIRAGLELREVLSKQSEVNVPVFVDNSESITSFKKPTGQLITSRVIAGQDLTIEVVTNE